MKRQISKISAAAILASCAFSANATVLLNEDFSGAVPALDYGTGPIAGTGFEVTAGSVDILGPSLFGCTGKPAGTKCLDLAGSPGQGTIQSIATFNLIGGDTYTLMFDYILQGFAPDSGTTSEFSVSLGSHDWNLTAVPTLKHAAITITPGSDESLVRLGFQSITQPDGVHGAVLSSISLTTHSQVPEPTTMLLLGTGLAALAVRARGSQGSGVQS